MAVRQLSSSRANSVGAIGKRLPMRCEVALTSDVTESMETVHGKKYIVDGELENPAGKGLGCVRFGLSMPEQIFRGW